VAAPPPSRMDLDREGVQLIEERGPTLLLDNRVLITGQVERVTDFEPGFPIQYRRSSRGWEPDFLVADDQGVIVNVREGHSRAKFAVAIVRSQASGSPEARASSTSFSALSTLGQPACNMAWASRTLVPKIE
jgi:hypothetical protein